MLPYQKKIFAIFIVVNIIYIGLASYIIYEDEQREKNRNTTGPRLSSLPLNIIMAIAGWLVINIGTGLAAVEIFPQPAIN